MVASSIALTHLVKKFGEQTVLNDINFIVPAGKIVGLIGPSGAGKSTIIKVALGMEVADAGNSHSFWADDA
jgi:ABC-2 type transport system ATP-binding protein